MKAKVFDLKGSESGEVDLPSVFNTPVRNDVIKRAVLAQQANRRQKYGTDPMAGKRTSAHYHGSRHYRYAMMNREMARMPRIHGKVGYLVWRARFAPQTVKGRRAHPPKAEKIWNQKINAKEKTLAIMSALAASCNIELVKTKHKTDFTPIIVTDDFENITKTKDVAKFLELVIPQEIGRTSSKKVRAGKGKSRGRKYKKKKGPLVIASKSSGVIKAAKNISGVNAASVKNLNIEMLAPGGMPGRLIITTKAALNAIEEKFGTQEESM